ncbi:protein adenylyltransferase SelO [Neptunicella marina]|uniref:Protein nucleotidyltransferase YdiU n=1 Tax=Neptunicella marina TaxID=2125989 RepID=A0A8J6ISA2_9ALTE|nr:YdiU family protein [Neptunicella marina]MBC3766540.1 YdiU family protein [Neptunicella marina]
MSPKFEYSYADLGDDFFQSVVPEKVSSPQLLLWNVPLAEELCLQSDITQHAAQYFSGNKLISGCQPVALAYAGHQFGHFNPQLGDGRAHLLGELLDSHHRRWDIQLKGSGATPFSRRGDGRCALGPAIREYIMSEAMYALGVPTSRSLAVVATGDTVFRQQPEPGAVVTRVASSHIRVGTFEYFAARKNADALTKLLDYSIERHFPHIEKSPEAFLNAVMHKQIELIVAWLRVGFIHGVMNTDNTAISGETIDFGPCAMMGVYHPGTVYSSIDSEGRYAYGRQPQIAHWNLARLAESLIPLTDKDEKRAVEKLTEVLNQFSDVFSFKYRQMLMQKTGLQQITEQNVQLVEKLLDIMTEHELDYTRTFNQLTRLADKKITVTALPVALHEWAAEWLQQIDTDRTTAVDQMQQANPVVIPRNHHVEAVLQHSIDTRDMQAVHDFLDALITPYTQKTTTEKYQDSPADGDKHYQTFCGT